MESVKQKRELVDEQASMMLTPSITPYKIITIVNAAWGGLFSNIEYNKHAIAKCRWLLFNCYLMLYAILSATIIREENEN